MAVTSGFFNSVNGDRKYNTEQISAMFSSIFKDGVLANIGTAFSVKARTGNSVTVGVGLAWFNDTWIKNDTALSVTLSASDSTLDRIDAVVIEVNHSTNTRNGSIKVVKGTPASSPKRPTMTSTQYIHQHPLAYITRRSGSSAITQSDITNMIGTSSCPYITGVAQVQDTDDLVARWGSEWTDVSTEQQTEFLEWFDSLKNMLNTDPPTSLSSSVADVEGGIALASGPTGAGHRKIFRGKNLGSTLTPEQSRAIYLGVFTDLYVGDYWLDANGIKWRIADFDYWYGYGDTPCNKHHIVVVPDKPVETRTMNDTATTTGGYVGSSLYRNAIQRIEEDMIMPVFDQNILSHREYFISEIYQKYPMTGKWYSSTTDLMNEYMVYGAPFYGTTNTGVTVPKLYNNSARQLALFALAPQYIIGNVEGTRASYWLRDIVSNTKFAQVTAYGPINEANASVVSGVRPAFGIVGTLTDIHDDLPKGYLRLSYIQSTGTQYFDTGFNPNQDTRVVMDVEPMHAVSPGSCFFGARVSKPGYFTFTLWATTNTRIRFDYGSVNHTSDVVNVPKRRIIDANKNICKIGNDEVITGDARVFQVPHSLTLLAVRSYDGAVYDKEGRILAAKLYSCQIYDNGTLIRDFVPAKDPDGNVGLFDIIERKFFENAGTGDFITEA